VKATPRLWTMDTPEEAIKGSSVTTPPGPALLQRQLEEDINLAISQKSLDLLSLALSRRHCCGEDHCLFEAVRCQNPGAVEFLLQVRPEELDTHCSGCRPLHVAIQVCSAVGDAGYVMAKRLLEHGAKPDACSGDLETMDSPLLSAAKRGSLVAMELLLGHGADPEALDASGFPPMHVICRQASLHGQIYTKKIIILLLHYGARPFQRNALGHEAGDYLQADCRALRELMDTAKWQWHRRSLRLVLGDVSAGRGGAGAREAQGWKLLFPELVEDIIRFL